MTRARRFLHWYRALSGLRANTEILCGAPRTFIARVAWDWSREA